MGASIVMPGLDPGIHSFREISFRMMMDCRVKPGNDQVATNRLHPCQPDRHLV